MEMRLGRNTALEHFLALIFSFFCSPLYSLLKGLKAKLFISKWLFKCNANVLLLKC